MANKVLSIIRSSIHTSVTVCRTLKMYNKLSCALKGKKSFCVSLWPTAKLVALLFAGYHHVTFDSCVSKALIGQTVTDKSGNTYSARHTSGDRLKVHGPQKAH